MKNTDLPVIKSSLNELSKLQYALKRNEYQNGIANLADTVSAILSNNANSFEYKSALVTLREMARNAKLIQKV